MKLDGLRFIDVRKRCIVDGQAGDKYVALSYLWGKSPSREDMLCESTAARLYKPFSLNAAFLPATVEDAIAVTVVLGEAYLCVDRLHIRQDDESDKARFVPRMHHVYGYADSTILAAAGMDCGAGLPGVRSATRTTQQKVVTLEATSMMESLDPLTESLLGRSSTLVTSTIYNTRAWCYQKRYVIMHPPLVLGFCSAETL